MSRLAQSPHRSRTLVAASVAVISVLLVQCDRQAAEQSPAIQTQTPDSVPTPPQTFAPKPASALSRGDLISASGRAASAYAEGQAITDADSLVGRSFSVRIPFGCGGPSKPAAGAAADGLARWSWGDDHKTILISLTPGDWTGSALTAPTSSEVDVAAWEAVEGFWIPHPWLTSASCPGVQTETQALETAATPQTLGIAAVFETGSSRVGRRNGRAYSFTVRAQGDQPIAVPTRGYRLLLEGRLVAFSGGRAIRCRAPGPDQRPVCVAAVHLDKVAFEDAAGAILSQWRPG